MEVKLEKNINTRKEEKIQTRKGVNIKDKKVGSLLLTRYDGRYDKLDESRR